MTDTEREIAQRTELCNTWASRSCKCNLCESCHRRRLIKADIPFEVGLYIDWLREQWDNDINRLERKIAKLEKGVINGRA